MRLRFHLIYELVIKSLWTIVLVLLAILGNFQTIVSLFPATNTWIGKFIGTEPIKSVLDWFSTSWLYLFLLGLSISIFEGFFRKTRKYLGDRKRISIKIENFPQNDSPIPHLSLKIVNLEKFDLDNCYATLLELQHFYNPTTTLDILEQVNPNNKFLSWGGGSPSEQISIPRSDGVNHGYKVLNIAKGAGNGIVFLFHGHEHNYQMAGSFRARIKIDGKIDGVPAETINTEFCFKFGTNITSSRRKDPELGEKQRIVIVPSQIQHRFMFEDCDKIWEERE
jgi:hypothetical protein